MGRQRLLVQEPDQADGEAGGVAEVGGRARCVFLFRDDALEAPGDGDRKRLQAANGALHGRGDGAGVGEVPAQVRAVVDAGDHDVGPAVPHDLQERQGNAVGGGAGAGMGEGAVREGGLAQSQRLVQRDAVAAGAARPVRRHDGDLGHRVERLFEHEQAISVHAVVVGNQDPHV